MPNPILVFDKEFTPNHFPGIDKQYDLFGLDCASGGADFTTHNQEHIFADKIAAFIKQKPADETTHVILFHLHGVGGEMQFGRNLLAHPGKLMLELKKRFPQKKFVFDVFACESGTRKPLVRDGGAKSKVEEADFSAYEIAGLAGATIMLNAGHKTSAPTMTSSDIYNPSEANFVAYKPILAKIFAPQDTLNLMIYGPDGKLHKHKITGPKPKKAEDLSDENLRKFLLDQVDKFAEFYREAKTSKPNGEAPPATINFAKFDEYIAQAKAKIMAKNSDFFADLRGHYCAIDIVHNQEKYLDLYRESGLDFSRIKHGANSVLKVAMTRKNYPLMKKLIDLGCDTNALEFNGRSPLALAIVLEDEVAAKLLIKSGKVDLNATDIFGGSNFIMRLAFCKNPQFTTEIFDLLAGKIDLDALNLAGKTARVMAIEFGNPTLAKKIDEYKAAQKAASEKAAAQKDAKDAPAIISSYEIPLFNAEKQKYLEEKGVKFTTKTAEDFTQIAIIEVEQSRLLGSAKATTAESLNRDFLGLHRVAINNISAEKRAFITKFIPGCTIEKFQTDETKHIVTFQKTNYHEAVLKEVTAWDATKDLKPQIAASEKKLAKQKPFLVCSHEGYESLARDANFAGVFIDIKSLKKTSKKHEEFAKKIAKLINDQKTPDHSPLDVAVLVHGQKGSLQLGGGEILHPALMALIVRDNIANQGPMTFDITSCEIGGEETLSEYKDASDQLAHRFKKVTIILNSGSQATLFAKAEPNQYSGCDYKTIMGKIFNPPDALRIVLYDDTGKYHTHQITTPKPQNPQDLSDENLRKFLLNQIENFERFYRQAKKTDKSFDDYIASSKQTAATMSTQDLASLRAGYCAIDIMHLEEKYLPHYVANGVNLNQIKHFDHSVMKIIGLTEEVSEKDIFSALVKNGFDVNQRDEYGNPPYLVAMASGKREFARKIMTSPGFDPNYRNTANDVSLSFFVQDPELMKLMLENPKLDLSAPTPAGKTPIALLAVSASEKEPDINILKQLVRRGANIHEKFNGIGLDSIPGNTWPQLVAFEQEFKKPSQYIVAKSPQEIEKIMKEKEVKDFKIIPGKDGSSTVEIHQTKMNKPLRDALGLEAKQIKASEMAAMKKLLHGDKALPEAVIEESKTDSTKCRITFPADKLSIVDQAYSTLTGKSVKAKSSATLVSQDKQAAQVQTS